MAAFSARWLEIADVYYAELSPDTQRQIDTRVAELLEDPYGPEETPSTRPATSGSPPTATAPA